MDEETKGYKIIKNHKGRAMVALRNFKIGEIVAKDVNYHIGTGAETSDHALQIGEDKFVDVAPDEDTNFVNHSCNPNTKYDIKLFGFIAIKPIMKNDEITLDYEEYEEDLIKYDLDFECLCNELNCRGKIIGKKRREKDSNKN